MVRDVRQQGLTKQYTQNPEAYQAYLKGRYWWNKRNRGGFERAIEYFNQGRTQKQVAQIVGVSRQRVQQIIAPNANTSNRRNGKLAFNDQRVKLSKAAKRTIYDRIEAGDAR